MRVRPRAVLLVAAVVVLAIGVATSDLAAAHPDTALGGGSWWQGGLQVTAAVGAVVAGLFLVLDRRLVGCGVLLALTGPAILVAQLPSPAGSSTLVFTLALVAGSAAPALAGAAALTLPVIRVGWLDRAMVALGLTVELALQGLLPATIFGPRSAGCFACPANLVEVHADPALHTHLVYAALVATVVWAALFAVRILWRWLRAAGIVRLLNAPLVLGGAAVCVLTVWSSVHTLGQATPETDFTVRALWLWQCGLVLVMSSGVAVGGLRARRLARTVASAVIASVPDAERLRSTLAASINDPHLVLVFSRDGQTFIDAAGRDAAPDDGSSAVLTITRGDGQVAEIRYSARLVGAVQQLAAAVRAAGLAIEHVAARAQLLAEVAELAASRQRIVDAGDTERCQLERDLHDGAQQRLIAIQVMLQLAGSTASPEDAGAYIGARREVGVALEELRDLAHGIHPVALSDAGLAVGLRSLAETSRIPFTIDFARPRRASVAAETATYRLVADAMRTAETRSGPTAVAVTIAGDDADLILHLRAEGLDAVTGNDIVERAQDRFAALNGLVMLLPEPTGLTIEAVIPCGW